MISKSNLYSNEIERELQAIEQEWKAKMKLVENDISSKKPVKQQNVVLKMNVDEKINIQTDFKRPVSTLISEEDRIPNKFLSTEFLLTKIFIGTNINEKFKDKTHLIEYLVKRVEDLMTAGAKSYIKDEINVFEIQNQRQQFEFNQKYLNYRSKIEMDNNLDSDDEGQSDEKNDYKKPLPYYDQLKEEAKFQQLKIKEFFKPTFEEDKEEERAEEGSEKRNEDSMGTPIMLPEVDSISQKQIRERIFFEKLFRNMESILKYSNFDYKVINIELKNHVKNLISVLK